MGVHVRDGNRHCHRLTEPIVGYLEHITDHVDQSQLLVNIKTINKKATYYAGFAWDQAGEISTKSAWEKHLSEFSERLKNKPKIEILN